MDDPIVVLGLVGLTLSVAGIAIAALVGRRMNWGRQAPTNASGAQFEPD